MSGEWQPIATAPTDGNDILLYWSADVPGEGTITSTDMCFFDNGAFLLSCECGSGIRRWQPGYTHWMPVPAPPVIK